MANYKATTRSNYFRVKDPVAFREWADSRQVEVQGDNEKGFMMYSADYGEGGWPNSVYNEDANDYVEVDLTAELSEHLIDGDVAILMEVGNEKLRYLIGWATAVNSNGEVRHVNLTTEIQDLARALGSHVGSLEY